MLTPSTHHMGYQTPDKMCENDEATNYRQDFSSAPENLDFIGEVCALRGL